MKYKRLNPRAAFLFFSIFIISAFGAQAQVHVAPVALYLSDDDKTGRIVVHNSSDQPQELNIDLLYAYPDTDEDGNVYLKKFDAVPEEEPSAAGWIRVYPRNLILPPNDQQTIRFAARPPANLQQGEYLVRPAISVRNAEGRDLDINNGISATINLIKRTIISVNYRHGNVSTGISIPDMESDVEDDRLTLLANLERKGNAAYLGHSLVRIYDRSGAIQKQIKRELAVYRTQKRKFEIDTDELPRGSYRAELTLSTESRSEENGDIINAPPVTKTVEFTIK